MARHTVNRTTVFIICLGLIISFSIFFLVKHWEEGRRYDLFRDKAKGHAVAIHTALEHVSESMDLSRFLIDHSINVKNASPLNPNDFMPLSVRPLINDPDLLSIAWAVVENDRSQAISGAPENLKVIYMQKGIYSSEDEIDTAIGDYYDKWFHTISMPPKARLVSALLHKDPHPRGNELNLIASVTNRLEAGDSLIGDQIGVLIAEWHVNGLIEHAIKKMPVAAQDITLLLVQDDGHKEAIYTHHSRSRHPAEQASPTSLRYEYPFNFAGLHWQMDFEAAPQFLRDHIIVVSWQLLILALLLTLFIAWYMRFALKQTRTIEEQVIKRTEELAKSEERFRRIIDNLQDTYYRTDAEGSIQTISPSIKDFLGYTPQEVIGTNIGKSYLDPEGRSKFIKALEGSERGKLCGYESEATHKDGHALWVSRNAQFLCDEQGEVIGIEGTIRDITDRKKAEEENEHLQAQLLQSQKLEAIGTLAGGVAHDFNNILTAIIGNTELALLKVDKTTPLWRNLLNVKEAGNRAADLTRQLLLYSRKQSLMFTTFNINSAIDSLLKMVHRLIGENITIETNLAPNLWTMKADKGNIEQVIMNLAVNARDSMPEGGALTISTDNSRIDDAYCKSTTYATPGSFIRMTISDTGTGMDEATMQRIFEPFFTTKGLAKGTGLGMSVVYGIVRKHRGWINVESAVGNGTTFEVYLPASCEKAEETTEQEASLEEFQGNGERILLVEDEEVVRDFGATVLGENGYVVVTAGSVEEACAIFESEEGRFDLIFSDVVLADKDGVTLVNKLISLQPGINILMSSGYTDERSKWPIIEERGYPFLQKPYTISGLLKTVSGILC